MAAAGFLQKVIRVLREPGVALGMSVAGGTGSTASGKENEVEDRLQLNSHYILLLVDGL